MARTVLEYTYVEFDDNWNMPINWGYEATKDNARLTVVTDDRAGNKKTYFFKLKKGSWVQQSRHENIMFIPDICRKRADGDKTNCRKK